MRLALMLVAVGLGAWPATLWAQPTTTPEPAAPVPAPAAAPTPTPLATPADVVALSLADAIAIGISNNTDVQLARFEPPIADYDHVAAWGIHDPVLYGDYTYTSASLPIASTFFPGQFTERISEGNAGVSGLVPRLGWTYQLGYHGDSTSTNSLVTSLGKTYTSNVTMTLRAPLLRGAWWGSAWTLVELTGIESAKALEEFRERLMDIVAGIETGYWNLAATKQALGVAEKSLQTSRALLGQVQAQYEVGVVSRVEVTEAEAGVADREFRQITALNLYRAAQDTLIDLVYGPKLTPTSRLEIEPTDRPENYVTFELDAEASMQRAMDRRPELTIAMQRVEQSEIQLKFAKNERLPQVDLVGSYGTHGLSGNDPNCSFGALLAGTCPVPNPPTQPPGIGTDYADNDDFWFDGNDNRVWVGGAVLSVPIPNTTARANVSRNELDVRRAKTVLRRTEQEIVKEVRDAVRNLESALEGVEAAERNVAASNEQLRAEKIRLEHGESTPFDVLLREEALSQAENQRIAALRVYHGSVTALDRAQGTLLEDRSIVLEDALTLR